MRPLLRRSRSLKDDGNTKKEIKEILVGGNSRGIMPQQKDDDNTKEEIKEILVGGNSRGIMLQQKDDDNTKEEIKEMVGGYSGTRSVAVSITDEVLFEILLPFPPQDIYYVARLVCREWYHMIRSKCFIQKHLEQASYGILYKDESGDVVFISARKDRDGIDTYKLKYIIKTKGIIWSSCNGLMLERARPFHELTYSLTNVLTGQTFSLPSCSYPGYYSHSSGIGYDATSMTYKVVVSYSETGYGLGCAILTVGVDKSWRRVRTDHLSDLVRKTIVNCPILTEGFVHWNTFGGTRVLTLNLETEIITETPPPISKVARLEENTECYFISTGRYLSLFLCCRKLVWEVFEMKPETGKWRKLPNICLEGQEGRIIEMLGFKFYDHYIIKPCGWLKYPEVLALRSKSRGNDTIIFYNLITCEIGVEKVSPFEGLPLVTHKNSLVLPC